MIIITIVIIIKYLMNYPLLLLIHYCCLVFVFSVVFAIIFLFGCLAQLAPEWDGLYKLRIEKRRQYLALWCAGFWWWCHGHRRDCGPPNELQLGCWSTTQQALRKLSHQMCIRIGSCYAIPASWLLVHDPGRARTCNPRLHMPMPYPLGHGASELHKVIL